ncbi:MAG: endonuclease/exonuclease/phosphatase family protein [Myxococcota bacterium]
MSFFSRSVATLAIFAFTSCGSDSAEPYDLQIDTFNVALAGAFIPFEDERRGPIVEALNASTSDVVCVQEAWRQSDKDMILTGTSGTFPHTASFVHDLDSAIDDATDQSGNVPPAPTTPPCAGALTESLDAALSCLQANCSTVPGSEDGQTTSSACAQDMCIEAVTTLLLGSADSLRCYSCLATSLPTEPFRDMRELCTGENNAELAFRGQSGVMILSKHPIENAEAFVLPGTWNRRVVAEATVSLPNGSDVDVYCNHLTPIFDSLAFPYTGPYGDDQVGADGWAAEQLLQAEKLIRRVQDRSGDRPAVILGDMNAGRAHEDATFNEGLLTLELLESVFTPAVTSDFVPRCTHCPESINPISSEDTPPVWIDHIFMFNVDASAVQSTEIVLDQPTVPAGGTMVPLSDHFALRSVITID